MLRALYRHNVDLLANKFTLEHLKKYNMEWGEIPVAPEARDQRFKLFGDQYVCALPIVRTRSLPPKCASLKYKVFKFQRRHDFVNTGRDRWFKVLGP